MLCLVGNQIEENKRSHFLIYCFWFQIMKNLMHLMHLEHTEAMGSPVLVSDLPFFTNLTMKILRKWRIHICSVWLVNKEMKIKEIFF